MSLHIYVEHNSKLERGLLGTWRQKRHIIDSYRDVTSDSWLKLSDSWLKLSDSWLKLSTHFAYMCDTTLIRDWSCLIRDWSCLIRDWSCLLTLRICVTRLWFVTQVVWFVTGVVWFVTEVVWFVTEVVYSLCVYVWQDSFICLTCLIHFCLAVSPPSFLGHFLGALFFTISEEKGQSSKIGPFSSDMFGFRV